MKTTYHIKLIIVKKQQDGTVEELMSKTIRRNLFSLIKTMEKFWEFMELLK